MKNIDSFKEFLQKKKLEEKPWVERKEKWLESVSNLYNNIANWFSPFIQEGLMVLKTDFSVTIIEEHIGQYSLKRLDIYIGSDIISLKPKGTLVSGYLGRIDMTGPKGVLMLVETEWNKWKFAKRTPKFEEWEVSEDSFVEAIKDII